MKQISIVWVVRYWRECESHHDLLASLWISEFSNISCDIDDWISSDLIVEISIDMSTIWKMIKKSMKKIMHRMRANFCEHTSMQRMQIRAFLTWLESVRESDRLICEKIRYLQHYLFFLIDFWVLDRVFVLFAKSKCNDCIIRFLEAILCDFIIVSVQYAFSKRYYLISSSFECVMTE